MSGLRLAVLVATAACATPALAGPPLAGRAGPPPAFHRALPPPVFQRPLPPGTFAPMARPNPAVALYARTRGGTIRPDIPFGAFDRGVGFYRRPWTTYGAVGWGGGYWGPTGTYGPSSSTVVIAGPAMPGGVQAPSLPTAADLPVANVVREPADPALLYVVNDLSHGRSGRPGGAKIISAGPAVPIRHGLGSGPMPATGPHVIELTAR